MSAKFPQKFCRNLEVVISNRGKVFNKIFYKLRELFEAITSKFREIVCRMLDVLNNNNDKLCVIWKVFIKIIIKIFLGFCKNFKRT